MSKGGVMWVVPGPFGGRGKFKEVEMSEPKYGYDYCAFCDIRFPKKRINQKYCHPRCRTKDGVRRHKESQPDEPLYGYVSCEQCQTSFPKRFPHQRFCSYECQQGSRYSPIKLEEEICIHCGTPFIPKNKRQVYCSHACRRNDKNMEEHLQVSAKRKCATCGKPTNNYRCDRCWKQRGWDEQQIEDSDEMVLRI